MQDIKILIDSFGFPIACCVVIGIFIWNIYNKMSNTLDKVTETNAELVLTNSNLSAKHRIFHHNNLNYIYKIIIFIANNLNILSFSI